MHTYKSKFWCGSRAERYFIHSFVHSFLQHMFIKRLGSCGMGIQIGQHKGKMVSAVILVRLRSQHKGKRRYAIFWYTIQEENTFSCKQNSGAVRGETVAFTGEAPIFSCLSIKLIQGPNFTISWILRFHYFKSKWRLHFYMSFSTESVKPKSNNLYLYR